MRKNSAYFRFYGSLNDFLSSCLRLLGFDTWYRHNCDDEDLAAISDSEQRILLTRDRGLLKRRIVTYGYWVREIQPIKQSREILQRFALWSKIEPFRRCLRCKGLRELCGIKVTAEGYRLSHRIAMDNLKLDISVIADSCNPLEITRRE